MALVLGDDTVFNVEKIIYTRGDRGKSQEGVEGGCGWVLCAASLPGGGQLLTQAMATRPVRPPPPHGGPCFRGGISAAALGPSTPHLPLREAGRTKRRMLSPSRRFVSRGPFLTPPPACGAVNPRLQPLPSDLFLPRNPTRNECASVREGTTGAWEGGWTELGAFPI